MMKKNSGKFLLTIFICFTLLPFSLAKAFTFGEGVGFGEGEPIVSSCPGKYFEFLNRANSTFARSELIKDVFTRSLCQVYDIMELQEEMDLLRDEIRSKTFAVCTDISDLEKRYLNLKMEQEFVRNLNAVDNENIENMLNALKSEMRETFVVLEAWILVEDFDDLWEIWVFKYQDKVGKNYKACGEGPWAELKESISSFGQTMSEISFKTKDWELEKFEKKTKEERKAEKHFFFEADIDPALKFGGDKKNQVSEKVSPKISLDEAIGEGQITSLDAAFEFLNSGNLDPDVDRASAERIARYKTLYGMNGAALAGDMLTLLGEMNDLLDESNSVDFPAIQDGIDRVYGRWCQ